jgi:DNA mismatch repair protein MutS
MISLNENYNKDTPIIQQYKEIKKLHKDKILFFHLGDFYEMFYEDAEIVSKTLGLTLTYRKNSQEKIYMCGIPVANKDFYIKKLLKESFKIAICQQTETVESCKKRGGKLVHRNVTAIYTSGTYVDENSFENNFIMILTNVINKKFYDNKIYIFYIDISTEEFFYEIIKEEDFQNTLKRINPKEIIIEEEAKINLYNYEELVTYIKIQEHYKKEYIFNNFNISKKIEDFLIHENIEEFNLLMTLLFFHLQNTYNPFPTNPPIMAINSCETSLDKYTIDNLDLFGEKFSLYNLLNKNFTPQGKRILKNIILKPLINIKDIKNRLEVVNFFYYHTIHKSLFFYKLKEKLQFIGDGEKILFLIGKDFNKIHYSTINIFLRTLKTAEEIINFFRLEDNLPPLIGNKIYSYKFMNEYKKLEDVFVNNENYFKDDFLNKIYENNNINKTLKEINNHLEDIKKQIPNVKLTSNNIIGYFFEITYKDKGLLKEEFIIKQSLLNNIRFTTKQLVELEGKLKLMEIEKEETIKNLLKDFLNKILTEKESIKILMEIIGWIDVFFSFGRIAVENNYHLPIILDNNNKNNFLSFKNASHPIIKNIKENFITNDLNMENKQITFITGPNMGGKSTFMRTTALIVLMAQIGSYVPAENLQITPFKNIFVRIGYNDDYKEGESTFYKEMKECGDILNKCLDKNNIVFFDEICRGTSYEDGIILSKSIIKYLIEKGIACLISSHYLELGKFFQENYQEEINILYTSYKYENNKLVFLYKMLEGLINDSFGIKVSEMAGLPKEIIDYAYLLKKS